MVLVLSIPPNEAIKRFAEARGHEIERENYISSIKLHDSNSNLKQTANTLPVLIPKIQLAIKRSNQTEIDNERYDDRKKRNFNSDTFSKSNAKHSRSYNRSSLRNFTPDTSSSSKSRDDAQYRHTNNYRDRRHYQKSEMERRYGCDYGSSYRSSWKNSSNLEELKSRRDEFNFRPRKPYDSRTSRRSTDGNTHRRSRWDNNYKNQSDHQ